MHERLKKIIFKKLDQDLGHAEIIVDDNNSIWFIDRGNKYWYLELKSVGVLWWRYSFFNDFFPLFGMERKEYEPVIAEWVEEVLKHGVSSTVPSKNTLPTTVEEVLKHGVSSTIQSWADLAVAVEEVLKHGVSSTEEGCFASRNRVEEVLKHGVSSTNSKELLRFEVEKILSLKAGVGENKMKMKKIFKKFTSK
jgi:hypothetical protein